MSGIKRKYNRNELENINDLNLSRKELQAWGTGIIADARPKKKRRRSGDQKKLMSRKEYIKNQEMKEKWLKHYGRRP